MQTLKYNVACRQRKRALFIALLCFVLLSLLVDRTLAVKWIGLYREKNVSWNDTEICRKLRQNYGLTNEQTRMCRKLTDGMPFVHEAAALAVNTCQNLFRHDKWNCSTIKLLPKLLPDLAYGTKERAFVHAVSAAALTYTIARGCASSAMQHCSCSPHPTDPPNGNFKWGGCGDNIVWGARFSRQFIEVKRKPTRKNNKTYTYNNFKDYDLLVLDGDNNDDDIDIIEYNRGLTQQIKKHNGEVGRKVVSGSLVTHCKCHGVSGSCSIKTCWRGLPLKFNEVGEKLMAAYEKAVQIHPLTRPDQVMHRFDGAQTLLYAVASPNYCDYNTEVGSFGTSGRECNATANAADNCDTLCCGRGYKTVTIERTERCNCKYHWCCYVTCDNCKSQKTINVCV